MKTILAILCLFLSSNLLADRLPYWTERTEVTNVTEITNITEITNAAQGTALAIASGQHQFDYATPAWQASLSGSAYKNESAASVAIGKNFGGILINGSISRTGNDNAYGIAGNWRFK